MINFRSFPKIKILLRAAVLTGLLLNLQSIWGTDYTWTGGGSDTNWTTSANWTPSTGSPGTGDTVYIPGTAETTITINSVISIENITLNSAGSELITIILGNDLTCTDTLYLVHKETTSRLGNVLITGSGKFTTKAFDFPNSANASLSGHHKFEIGSSSTLKITNTFYGDANIQLDFTGSGTLDLPASGINLDYGTKKVNYGENLQITSSSPLSYYQRLADTTISASGTITNFPANVVLTKKIDVSWAKPTYLYTATVIGEENKTKFTLNGTTLTPGITSGTLTINNPSSTGTAISDYGYKQSFSLSHTGTGTGDGISITIYAPDESGLEISTIKYNCDVNTWLGTTSSDASKANNWSNGVPADVNQYVAIGFPKKNYPELFDGSTITCKSIILSPNSSLKLTDGVIDAGSITCNGTMTQSSGAVKTQSIIAGSTGSFTQTNGSLELRNDGTTPAKISGSVAIKNLSIAEGAEFTMPFDMNLTNLNLNAGAKFSKGGHNLTIGWLMAATDNYSGVATPDITLSDAFEADSIIILLRKGNITATNTLSARKDFIIGGAIYNSSTIKYEAFVNRPSNWVQSFTDTSLSISGSSTEGSTFKLSDSQDGTKKGQIKAGTSGNGNFYINGANFTGTSSGGNYIIIPQNDSPENFCAEAVNSTISNITVTCADGTSDGSHAQIPATGCSLTGCTNFDSEDFGIASATTVSDNRIYLKFPRPIRKITYPSAIKISDGTGFTAEYASETGSDAPANPKSSLYLYTANTTWNTDASGTSAGSGNYTNSKGEYRTVIPYLVIPQYITDSSGNVTCGYLITDKWGKRLKAYAPDASAFKDVTDGIPEDKKTKRTPPEFSLSLSPVNNNQIVLGFSKPIITSSSKISYYIDSDNRISISQTMEELLPRCFEIVSIDSAGNAASADIQIDKNSRASISQSSTGLSTITLTLTRNITLSDIENLYIRLIAPKDDSGNLLYPITTYDHQTGKTGLAVSFIQESDKAHTKDGAIYMPLNTAHSISDFAIGAINPSYAYNSGISDGGEDLASAYRNIYGEGSSAVHDFSKNQKNYGTISYGSEITLVSKSTSSINSLKLFITDDVDSDSFFKTFSSNFDKQSEAWLPNLTGKIFNYYSSALNSNFQTFNGEAIKSGASNQGFNTIIPKESVIKMKSGSQLSFVYTICDSSQNPLSHILSPIMTNTETGTYDLSKSISYPLFAFNLSNSSDLLSLSPWYITLKSITKQRGGVTILNNVINAAAGEKTVLKVNMPSSGNLDIMIMTIDGNIVKYLAHGNAGTGEHFYYWDGRNNAGSEVARGMYFVIIKGPGIDENRKVMVVK